MSDHGVNSGELGKTCQLADYLGRQSESLLLTAQLVYVRNWFTNPTDRVFLRLFEMNLQRWSHYPELRIPAYYLQRILNCGLEDLANRWVQLRPLPYRSRDLMQLGSSYCYQHWLEELAYPPHLGTLPLQIQVYIKNQRTNCWRLDFLDEIPTVVPVYTSWTGEASQVTSS